MTDRPRDLLQDVRNRVDTAQTGWTAFKASSMLKYDVAYKLHSGALSAVKETLTNDSERLWLVLNIVLAGALAGWVPRLLSPVGNRIDALTDGWAKDALKEINGEAQELIQDSILGQMKNRGNSTNDAYEAVVESTLIYGTRLELGIAERAKILLGALDTTISSAESWSMTAARSFQWSFFNNCPFITDMPSDTNLDGDFMKNFMKQAELRMWVEWALARPESWWRAQWTPNSYYRIGADGGNYDDAAEHTLMTMNPVLNRLTALGVPLHEVSFQSYKYGSVLDMLKMIEWAKHVSSMARLRSSASEAQVCRAAESGLLNLRRREGVCYPGGH